MIIKELTELIIGLGCMLVGVIGLKIFSYYIKLSMGQILTIRVMISIIFVMMLTIAIFFPKTIIGIFLLAPYNNYRAAIYFSLLSVDIGIGNCYGKNNSGQ